MLVYSTLVEAWTTVSTSGREVWKDGNFEQHITYGSWGIEKVNISRWEFMHNFTLTDMNVFLIKMYKMTYFFLFLQDYAINDVVALTCHYVTGFQ